MARGPYPSRHCRAGQNAVLSSATAFGIGGDIHVPHAPLTWVCHAPVSATLEKILPSRSVEIDIGATNSHLCANQTPWDANALERLSRRPCDPPDAGLRGSGGSHRRYGKRARALPANVEGRSLVQSWLA